MLTRVTVLETLETYYDTVPRAAASAEEAGPFTLFVKTEPTGWPYYARPRLGGEVPFTAAASSAVCGRVSATSACPRRWRHETTPPLAAARESGLHVHECPLLVLLPEDADLSCLPSPTTFGSRCSPRPPTLGAVLAAVGAVAGSDEVTPRDPGASRGRWSAGLLAVAGAYDGLGPVGGGSHSPRGTTTELAGIAVVPGHAGSGSAPITHALVEDARRRGGDGVPSPPRTTPSPGSTSGSASSGSARRASRSPRRRRPLGRLPYSPGPRRVAHEHLVGR